MTHKTKRTTQFPTTGFFYFAVGRKIKKGNASCQKRKEVFSLNNSIKVENGVTYKLIFCKSIRRNGKTIYPKNTRFFKFWVEDKAA